ncbi:MAG: flavodoxin [Bacteroidales bacterium]|nr:MAG: flavodoxin [Bacteroidales bacterium]
MKRIGLFYGPEGGSVERVALKIAGMIGEGKVDLHPIKDSSSNDLEKYDNLILGISTIGRETWSSEPPANDWDVFLPQFDNVKYQGKKFALYGLGNHISYALHFVDALGTLGKILTDHNAEIIGQVSTEGYEFEDSQAVIGNQFIGLPLDEDFESEKTDERIINWLDIIIPLFK